jgi:protein involved in polysaccharide export with SLBB domain
VPSYAERGAPSGAVSNAAPPAVPPARAADSIAVKASSAGEAAPGDGVGREKLEPGGDVEDKKLTSTYRVGEGDVLDIKPKGAVLPGSTLYTVLAGGLLEYPPLGVPLTVAGMTTDEIADRLDSELRRRGSGAGLTVNTREYVSHTILVSGMVESRGTKVLRREAVPLYVIMAEAQPLKEAGRVIVNSYATGRAVEVRLEDIHQEDLLVRPGDVINVAAAEPEYYYISGRVPGPGEKQFRRGLTLSQAILAAGGVLKVGRYCAVSRAGADGKLVTLRVDLRHLASGVITDPALEAGDRVEVF